MRMELIKKTSFTRLKDFLTKIADDKLFLLASSTSYYSALGIAPFFLIVLGVSSYLGGNTQAEIIRLTFNFSPEVGKMIQIIIKNVNEGVTIGSISGIIGVIILLSTASLVFLQLRYALDVIYEHHHIYSRKSVKETILEKLFAMLVVIIGGAFLLVASSLPGLFRTFLEGYETILYVSVIVLHLLIYVAMFWGIHFFVPSQRPQKREAFKMALLSSVFFVLGNFLLSSYLRGIAVSSIYGAAGTLFIFLLWTYYTSFTMFLSVEVFLYLKQINKYRKLHK